MRRGNGISHPIKISLLGDTKDAVQGTASYVIEPNTCVMERWGDEKKERS